MTKIRNIQKAPNGFFYLRLQRNGKDRRISLKTRNFEHAKLAAHILHATLSSMKIDPAKIKNWTVKIKGDDEIEIHTENNSEDRSSALEAVKIWLDSRQANDTYKSVIQTRLTKTLGEAILEYMPVLTESETAVKSQRMAESTLLKLAKILGGDFNMSALNDDVIESKWLNQRFEEVEKSTARRDLSFIRSFVEWAADKKRKYTPAPLTLTVEAKSVNWDYFTPNDLKLIFDNLPNYATEAWQFWIPLIGLYTGARISEIAGIRVADFTEKYGIKAVRMRGTKTDASDRTIPIHSDLIALGLLDYLATRRNKTRLFEVKTHNQNGAGATASKWFTPFKQSLGFGKYKVFHSFRPTLVDHLKQAGVGFEARCQYVGHNSGGGVHNKVYARNELNLTVIKNEVVDKIDWQKYCGWQPDFELLKYKIDQLNQKTG